jgi:hypothetical protein
MGWEPGSLKRRLELREPHDDVPPHLAPSLLTWITAFVAKGDMRARLRVLQLQLELDMVDGYEDPQGAWTQLRRHLQRRPLLMLDAIEWYLSYGVAGDQELEELAVILQCGGSAYELTPDGSQLQRRTDPTTKQAVEDAVAAGVGSAPEHLAAAWNALYSRNPDPPKAYDEAVLAVEAAAAPIVAPKDDKTTLGKQLAGLRARPDKWRYTATHLERDGVEAAISMIDILWRGQSRHAGNAPTRRETLQEAEAAIHLAATLVHWFSTGVIARAEADVNGGSHGSV